MKVIVGLGNPGKEYEQTRHNIGFAFVDYIARQTNATFNKKFSAEFAETNQAGEKVILLKPQTFMNNSGSSVQELAKFYKIPSSNIFIAFDDLDIVQGEYKIQKKKYPKVHNGINDIINKLGSDDCTFVRIGIDDRAPELRKLMSGKDYVLQRTSANFDDIFSSIYSELKKVL